MQEWRRRWASPLPLQKGLGYIRRPFTTHTSHHVPPTSLLLLPLQSSTSRPLRAMAPKASKSKKMAAQGSHSQEPLLPFRAA
jgi:hypothetical protein